MFRVIIAGTRSFSDYKLLCEKCDYYFSRKRPDAIVCGEARGADLLGRRYAEEHGIEVMSYPADWETFGRRAGYVRNLEMARNAEALIAFWDGKSKGTENMILAASEFGLQTRVVRYDF